MTILEAIGFLSALLYLLLAMKENRWCWPAGALSSVCYLFVFYEASLFTESALQLFYVGISWHGFVYWRSGAQARDGAAKPPPIRTMTFSSHVAAILICGMCSALLSYSLSFVSSAEFLLADSSVTVFSIFATILVARKFLENWVYWLVVDLFAAGLYAYKGLYLTVILYVIYVVMAGFGYWEWRSRYLRESAAQGS